MTVSIHATCIALDGFGVLLRGPSGCGKSDLALRLIDQGARLVGDDYCLYSVRDGELYAMPHPEITGLLEVRGLGPMRLDCLPSAPIRLVVDLVPRADVVRFPVPETEDLFGVDIPRIRLHAFDASTPAKVRLAATFVSGDTASPT